MNTIANLNYDEKTRRLALGLEFEDYLRETELVHPVRAEIEYQVPHQTPQPSKHFAFSQSGLPPKGLLRNATGRYSLSYYPSITEQVSIRAYDYERCYVPRRFRAPIRTLADVIDREDNEVLEYMDGHIRNIIMFPGAGYHLLSQATGLRGRVLRNNEPMRWAYISATLAGSANVIARARGDDRGEFLLVLPAESAPAVELTANLAIDVRIAGPVVEAVPATDDLPDKDNLWDLPMEILSDIGAVDTVSNGTSLPAGYTEMSASTVQFTVGRILTGREVADFNFVLP